MYHPNYPSQEGSPRPPHSIHPSSQPYYYNVMPPLQGYASSGYPYPPGYVAAPSVYPSPYPPGWYLPTPGGIMYPPPPPSQQIQAYYAAQGRQLFVQATSISGGGYMGTSQPGDVAYPGGKTSRNGYDKSKKKSKQKHEDSKVN